MFEQRKSREVSPIWKVLPLALVTVALVLVGIYYLGQFDKVAPAELTGILHHGDPVFGWYRKYVELRDPQIEMGLNFAGKRIVKFAGIVENGGERTLDVVEVKLSFFNYDELVWETTRTPIRPGPYTDVIPPLSQKAFALYFEKIPKGWKASHAEMAIEGFRFAESQK